MTRTKRAVLTLYGVASAFIFVWVPWRGYETPIYQVPKDRWNSTFLGYGLIWSQPRPPAEFVAYYFEDIKYAEDFSEIPTFSSMGLCRYAGAYEGGSGSGLQTRPAAGAALLYR